MSFHHRALLAAIGADAGATGYQLARSVRMRSASPGFFSRVHAAGNQKTWTFAAWIKRGTITGTFQNIFGCGNGTTDATALNIQFDQTTDQLRLQGWLTVFRRTNRAFRDTTGWMHLCVGFDGVTGSASIEVNLVAETSFAASNNPTNTNYGIGQAATHSLGGALAGGIGNFDGYMADVHFIDGQKLPASDFAQLDTATNSVVPKAFAGTYGATGYRLDFVDNSGATAATIGADRSGNGNNYTPSGISVTPGVTNDSLVDTPTNYGTDTGLGGEVRGNYCVLNPLDKRSDLALTNANLTATGGTANATAAGTQQMKSGQWIFSTRIDSASGGVPGVGVMAAATSAAGVSYYVGQDATSWGIFTSSTVNGQIYNNGASISAALFTYAVGDEVVIAVDIDAGKGWFGRYAAGVLTWATVGGVGNPATGANPSFTFTPGLALKPAVRTDTSGVTVNFGQRAWGFTAPSPFKAICTQNLPTPAVANPTDGADVNLRTGTGAAGSVPGKKFGTNSIIVSKSRSAVRSWHWGDSVRGVGKYLSSDSTAVETADAQAITAFNATGFSFGTSAILNNSGETIVDLMLRLGALYGVDARAFTGTGAALLVAHGLGVPPELIIYKGRTGAVANWAVGSSYLNGGSSPWNYYVNLNSTNGQAASISPWNNTAPSSTQFTVGANAPAGVDHIAYLVASIPGFSKIGTYVGNGAADGPFVNLGFRPRYFMRKRIDTSADGSWLPLDTARSPANPAGNYLSIDTNAAEGTGAALGDFVSQGYKARVSGGGNTAGGVYLYWAIADQAGKHARAA